MATWAVPGMGTVSEQDIIQLVGGEEEQTIDQMLDADKEREEKVLEELPKKRSRKALSDVLASLITTTASLEDMNFKHCDIAISLLKRPTALVNDKYMSKIKAKEQSLITRYLVQRQQETNEEQQQQRRQADNMVVRGEKAADNMDTDNPDFNSDGFVRQTINNDCQQRFHQATQEDKDEKEDWTKESDKEAATYLYH